jgi:hypothetical protein
MEDPIPRDQHSSWRDVIDSKVHKDSKEPSKIFRNLSLSTLAEEQNPTSHIDSCDAYSQCSENESLLSTLFSSTSTSDTRSTKISLSSRESCPYEDQSCPDEDNSDGEQTMFPASYDDTAIHNVPTRHVDYLSHNWREPDLWASWRLVTSKRKAYDKSARLKNASWRAWGKIRSNLRAVSPDHLNW